MLGFALQRSYAGWMSRFSLAPMDTLLRVFTLICYAIPLAFAGVALRAPAPISTLMFGVGAFVVALYAVVWCWFRPRAFTITPGGLEIEWPMRRRSIPASAIASARILTKHELREELGAIVRIGAGGLWGGFGLARTRRGTHELWVSRVDWMLWIQCEGHRSLLITPEEPQQFARELAAAGAGIASNSGAGLTSRR